MGSLDQESTNVTPATLADTKFDVFAMPALPLSGIESNVGHQLLGSLKTSHLSNHGKQGEGVDHPDAQELHAAQHQRLCADLPGNELMEPLAPFCRMVELLKISTQQLLLQGAPFPLLPDPLAGALVVKPSLAQTDGELVQIAFERVGGHDMPAHCALMGVEEFPALRTQSVRYPDAGSPSSQIDKHDAGCGHLVIVRVGLGVFAHVSTFQHHGPQSQSTESLGDLEAVGSRLHEEEVLLAKFRSPFQESFKGKVLPTPKLAGVMRRSAPENRSGVGVRVAIQSDNPPLGRWRRRGVEFRSSTPAPKGFSGVKLVAFHCLCVAPG